MIPAVLIGAVRGALIGGSTFAAATLIHIRKARHAHAP